MSTDFLCLTAHLPNECWEQVLRTLIWESDLPCKHEDTCISVQGLGSLVKVLTQSLLSGLSTCDLSSHQRTHQACHQHCPALVKTHLSSTDTVTQSVLHLYLVVIRYNPLLAADTPVAWLQVSSVCKVLAKAAMQVLGSSPGLNLQDAGNSCHQLGSALLRKWSPCVRQLWLDDNSCNIPGLLSFMEANAGSLRALDLDCFSMLAAAHFNHLMSSCSKVSKIQVTGNHMVSVLPPGVTNLVVDFVNSEDSDPPRWNSLTPAILLHRLARQQCLRVLTLDFSDFPAGIELACSYNLPELHSFGLDLALTDTSMGTDLSWLRRQGCRQLTVCLCVRSVLSIAHRHIIDQLKQIAVSNLTLSWHPPKLPHALQAMWAEVSVSKQVRLTVGKTLFDSASNALGALPRSPQVVMWPSYSGTVSGMQAIFLAGAVVSNPAMKVRLLLGKHTDLCMVGECACPSNLELLHS